MLELPDDVESLKRQGAGSRDRSRGTDQQLANEKLRLQIALLKRARYGRSSEQLDTHIRQLELTIEDLEASVAAPPQVRAAPTPLSKPARKPLPEYLPREEIVHESACRCPACGGALQAAGEDVAEMLEWVPGATRSCAMCGRSSPASAVRH